MDWNSDLGRYIPHHLVLFDPRSMPSNDKISNRSTLQHVCLNHDRLADLSNLCSQNDNHLGPTETPGMMTDPNKFDLPKNLQT